MNPRLRIWLLAAWAGLVVGVLGLNLAWPLPGQEGAWPWVLGMMAFPVAGALVLARRPRNGVGLAMGVVGTATVLIFVLTWYAITYPDAALSRPLESVASAGYIVQFASLVALLHLFPTGRPLSGWHARLFALFAWFAVGAAVVMPVRPGPLDVTGRPNPLGVGPASARAVIDDLGFGVIVVFGVVGLVALVVRWRRAGAVERHQLKWFLAGAAAVVVLLLLLLTGPLRGGEVREAIGGAFAVLAFWSLPAAMLIAVTRYRLFEIDRLISRTVAYALVIGVLVAVYAGGVLLIGSLLPRQNEIAVAASTLAVAALFNPLRRRVQQRVDRRFHRARYDGELELERFAGLLRDELDLDALGAELVTVATHTMEPATVSLWLRRDRGDS